MNAEFELKNVTWAGACAKEIVDALLIGWGCLDGKEIVVAGQAVADAVSELNASTASLIVVRLEYESGEMHGSVTAFKAHRSRSHVDRRPLRVSLADAHSPKTSTRRRHAAEPPTLPAAVDDDESVSLAELAADLGVSAWYVQRRMAEGSVPAADGEDDSGLPIWNRETIAGWRRGVPAEVDASGQTGHPLSLDQ